MGCGHYAARYWKPDMNALLQHLARLDRVGAGVTGGFTSRYKVHRLVRYEMFGDTEGAILREKQLKCWHRQWRINLIERDNPHWADLSVGLGFEPLTWGGRRNGS